MTQRTLTQLNKTIKTDSFDCGEEELNDFFKNDALNNQESWLSSTYVLHHDDTIFGFFTIIPDTLQKGLVSQDDQLENFPYAKYPAIKLARLAVDTKYQRQGIGTELLLHFFRISLDIVHQSGGRYITVDSKKSATKFYESFGFRKVESKRMAEFPPMYLDFYMLNNLSKK